jgi:hypothetical protein
MAHELQGFKRIRPISVGVSVGPFQPSDKIAIQKIETQKGTPKTMDPNGINGAIGRRLPRKQKRSYISNSSLETEMSIGKDGWVRLSKG